MDLMMEYNHWRHHSLLLARLELGTWFLPSCWCNELLMCCPSTVELAFEPCSLWKFWEQMLLLTVPDNLYGGVLGETISPSLFDTCTRLRNLRGKHLFLLLGLAPLKPVLFNSMLPNCPSNRSPLPLHVDWVGELPNNSGRYLRICFCLFGSTENELVYGRLPEWWTFGSPKAANVVVWITMDCQELTDVLFWFSLSSSLEEIRSSLLSLQEILKILLLLQVLELISGNL